MCQDEILTADSEVMEGDVEIGDDNEAGRVPSVAGPSLDPYLTPSEA